MPRSPRSPGRLPRFAARTLAAALPLLLAGCTAGGGSGGSPAGDRAVVSGPPGSTGPAATAEPLGRSTPHPSATRVTPSVSSAPCSPAAKSRLCFSAAVVQPVVDPRKPCVDGDQGTARGVLYVCLYGTWQPLPGVTP